MRGTTVALAILMLAVATRVYACSCAGWDPKPAFKMSTAVFVGEVVDASTDIVVYRAVERFKDAGGEFVRVNGQRGMCSYSASKVGSRHLIWAYGAPAQLQTGMCARSTPEDRAHADLRLLRQRGMVVAQRYELFDPDPVV